MTENPYAPPTSRVADSTPGTTLERPPQVTTAVRLLWLAVAIGFVSGFIALSIIDSSVSVVFRVVTLLIGWLVGLALFYAIFTAVANGRNWARILMLVFLLLRFAFAWLSFPALFALSAVLGAMGVLQFAVSACAVFLLFTPPANAWYRAMRR